METTPPVRYQKHDVPSDYLARWQQTINVLANVFDVPAGLIMRVLPEEIEVLIRSQTENNPYEPGEKANLNTGLYCETVMATRGLLHVPNALEDPNWENNPDVELNMISYVGMPLIWPDGSVFGTVCVLDEKELKSTKSYIELVAQFKDVIERDFQMLLNHAELKDTSRQLEDARKAAESANIAKSAFLANMSHELRTPMNAIIGYSEMLIEEAAEAEQEEMVADLKKINQAGTHLLDLINDVLDLSKIESGHMNVFVEDFDVASVIDHVENTCRPLVEKNDNQFSIERGDRLGHATQDMTKLRQSLLNLLSNAAKFTQEGSVTLSVCRDSTPDGDWLEFSVKDTGMGIPADKLNSIFDEFTQAESSITRDYGGTGLGLSISKRYCRMLGGELSVSSRVGEGSTFSIRIPALIPGVSLDRPTG